MSQLLESVENPCFERLAEYLESKNERAVLSLIRSNPGTVKRAYAPGQSLLMEMWRTLNPVWLSAYTASGGGFHGPIVSDGKSGVIDYLVGLSLESITSLSGGAAYRQAAISLAFDGVCALQAKTFIGAAKSDCAFNSRPSIPGVEAQKSGVSLSLCLLINDTTGVADEDVQEKLLGIATKESGMLPHLAEVIDLARQVSPEAKDRLLSLAITARRGSAAGAMILKWGTGFFDHGKLKEKMRIALMPEKEQGKVMSAVLHQMAAQRPVAHSAPGASAIKRKFSL